MTFGWTGVLSRILWQLWSPKASTLLYLPSSQHVRRCAAEMYAGFAKNLHSPTSELARFRRDWAHLVLVPAVVRH